MKLPKVVIAILCAAALILVQTSAVMALLEPALFQVIDLVVEPSEAAVGQTVTITANVTNVTDIDGVYDIKLSINDEVVDFQSVSLRGSSPLFGVASEVVEFTFTPSSEGTYTVAVGGQEIDDGGGVFTLEQATLTVTSGGTPPPTTTTPPPTTTTPPPTTTTPPPTTTPPLTTTTPPPTTTTLPPPTDYYTTAT